MTPQPSSKPSRLAAIALAIITALSLTACTSHGANGPTTATTRPIAADPVIKWQGVTPTPPTDPRALAVWSYMIEGAYAYNTKDYRRQQLANTATRDMIQGLLVSNAISDWYDNYMTTHDPTNLGNATETLAQTLSSGQGSTYAEALLGYTHGEAGDKW